MTDSATSRLSDSLIAPESVAQAIADEVAAPPFLLPSRHIEDALLAAAAGEHELSGDTTVPRLANYCIGRFRRGHERHPVELVSAAKSPKAQRPVHAMSFEQRVLYRALVGSLEEQVRHADRSDEAWSTFQVGPLATPDYRYIVRTDVVACYQYVDRNILADELVARTGNSSTVEALERLLGSIVGPRGLPQNLGPSHVLAEYYLDAVERSLLRKGLPTWRFADDVLLAADSWSGINNALVVLSDRLRDYALVINEEKTRFFRQETYRRWINRPEELLREAGGEALLAAIDEYDPDEPPDEEGRQLELLASAEVAVAMLERAIEVHKNDLRHDRLEVTVNRKIARGALRLMTILGDEDALPLVPDMLRFEPQLTPSIARYMRSVTQPDGGAVRRAMAACVTDQDLYLSTWQSMWLVEPLLERAGRFEEPLLGWLTGLLHESLPMVQARAAEALAWPDQIGVTEITAMYEASSPAAKPAFAAALALRCWESGGSGLESVRRDSPFNALVIDHIVP